MASRLLKHQKRKMVPKKVIKDEPKKFVLVGTYKGDQLDKWPGWYNYPIDASQGNETQRRRDAEVNVESTAKKINEVWLFKGKAEGRYFAAEFVGVKTRDELVKEYGYPAKGEAHGSGNYLLFKIEKTCVPASSSAALAAAVESVFVRTADFSRTPKVRKQLKAYLESPDRKDPMLKNLVPTIITKLPPPALRVCEEAVQLCLWPGISEPKSETDISCKDVSVQSASMYFPAIFQTVGVLGAKPEYAYPVISLFSGAMGLDLGLEEAGMSVRIGQDFDEACVETMRANNCPVLGGDIRKISPDTFLEVVKIKAGEPFLVCGGPPCQPFSTAGKRLGINDPRGSLFMDFIRMIDAIRPRFFVMENVKGIMSAPLQTEKNGQDANGTVLDVILSEFAKLHYKTVYGILDAVNYGVPQFRERFVLIGSRDGEDIFLPIPTHFAKHQNSDYRWRTLGDAIRDLENAPGEFQRFSPERARFLRMVPPGGNWRSLPKEVLKEAMGGAYESGGGKVGFYRRLTYAEPSPTVTTSPAQKATMLCHPTQLRTLSIKEYKRIQQFPDNWKLTGTVADQYRQIGNAVPVGLAKAIGQAIIATASGTSSIQTKRFRGTGVHNRIKDALILGGCDNGNEE